MNKNNKGHIDSGFLPIIFVGGFILAIIVLGGVGALGVPGGIGDNYSNGVRAGVITKLSHKGLFMKSWEGELNMGGMKESTDGKGHTTTVANIFEFSVTDEQVVKTIQDALDSGKPVKLTYHQYFIHPMGLETAYVVSKAEVK